MDFTYFLENKEDIEPANKSGLYIVMQKHLPEKYQAFRCGLAGRSVATARDPGFRATPASFSSRLGMYLNYWSPTDAQIFACLTVPKVNIAGFTEKILQDRREGDNRQDYQLTGTTRIAIREKQFHQLLVRYGMTRTSPRSEFFTGPLSSAKRALKAIGTGDYFVFTGNAQPEKTVLRRSDELATSQVMLRESPRLQEITASTTTVNRLTDGDATTARAIDKLRYVRTSPRFASGTSTPMTISMSPADLRRLQTDPTIAQAINKLKKIRPVRRSKRIAQKRS